MTDPRLALVSRNLRAEGYWDNDPDATLAAMWLLVLADRLPPQQATPTGHAPSPHPAGSASDDH